MCYERIRKKREKEKRRWFFPWTNSDLNLNCNNTLQLLPKGNNANVSPLSSILKLHVFLFVCYYEVCPLGTCDTTLPVDSHFTFDVELS